METAHELDEVECWVLLAQASLGRIALSIKALPAILPVQYYLDGRTLAICLGQHRIPTKSVEDTVVAFAADAVNSSSQSGWTVQAQGVAHLPASNGIPRDCGQPAAGPVVHVDPVTVTGYRFNLCPFLSDF
jgi:Pyridoxamine 5'-phosphate oxidase